MSKAESIWAGPFGDQYTDRNQNLGDRTRFWKETMNRCRPRTVLELGCNTGHNLAAIKKTSRARVMGIDVNTYALEILHKRYPRLNAIYGKAGDVPFRSGTYDMVFTVGVLIHQTREGAQDILKEMYRISKRWVLFGEYYAMEDTPMVYRGLKEMLWKRDYGKMFESLFPNARLNQMSLLSKTDGFDDVTVWLYEK